MGNRYKNLFDPITSYENLEDAFHKVSKGKRDTPAYLKYKENLHVNLLLLQEALRSRTYKPTKTRTFSITDPKPRNITALEFEDRIVQHAIHTYLYPIFDKVFLPQSYACRANKGTHSAAKKTQALIRKNPNSIVIKTDFSKYFHSIPRRILHAELMRKISCLPTLELIEKFVPLIGYGLNIGELLSQLLANLAGHVYDRWLLHTKKIKTFLRYMDDIVIIVPSIKEAKDILRTFFNFAHLLQMRLSHWFISSIINGINFVGYRIFQKYKLLRKSSVNTAKRKVKKLKGLDLKRFLASWTGHANHANTYNLLTKLGLKS